MAWLYPTLDFTRICVCGDRRMVEVMLGETCWGLVRALFATRAVKPVRYSPTTTASANVGF